MTSKPDVLIITDLNGTRVHRRILEDILEKVAEAPISWETSSIRTLTQEEKQLLDQLSRQNATRDNFMAMLENVKDELDKNKILAHAKSCDRRLYHSLSTGVDTAEALCDAYLSSIDRCGWESMINYLALVQDEASQQGYPNVIEVLFNHNVVATECGTPRNIPYHMLGRGFVAEGGRWPLYDKENNDTGNSLILLPMALARVEDEETQTAYAKALIDHEIVGHALLGLADHMPDEVAPAECIMSVPADRAEYFKLAKQDRGLQFCRECQEKIE